MTPRRLLLICALAALAWLGVLFVALCASRGYMPALLLALGAVWLYWRVTRVSHGYFD
jgi:hypothetical protein